MMNERKYLFTVTVNQEVYKREKGTRNYKYVNSIDKFQPRYFDDLKSAKEYAKNYILDYDYDMFKETLYLDFIDIDIFDLEESEFTNISTIYYDYFKLEINERISMEG